MQVFSETYNDAVGPPHYMPSGAPRLMMKKWGKDERGGLGPDLESDAYKAAAKKANKLKEFSQKQRR